MLGQKEWIKLGEKCDLRIEMRVEELLWLVALPATAECIASVWLPEMTTNGWDVKTFFLNVTGAALEGFFAALEAGAPTGVVGGTLASVAKDVRGSFLAAYTSWAGMVVYSGVVAREQGSVAVGIGYMAASVLTGMLGFFFGGRLASAFSRGGAPVAPATLAQTRAGLLGALFAFMAASYAMVRADVTSFDDESGVSSELPSLISFLDAEENRLLVAMACSVTGAAFGNYVGALVDGSGRGGDFALGTLWCNTLFSLLGLTLPAATLRKAIFQRSVLLQSFAGSFCGAASAFAGHCADSCEVWRAGRPCRALVNVGWNLLGAALLCVVGYELEGMMSQKASVVRPAGSTPPCRRYLSHSSHVSIEPTPMMCSAELLPIPMATGRQREWDRRDHRARCLLQPHQCTAAAAAATTRLHARLNGLRGIN